MRATAKLVLLCVTWFSSAGLAISEDNYNGDYTSKVLPFYRDIGQTGEMVGYKGLKLKYIFFKHPSPKGSIVISEGYNESFRKYAEVAYDLYAAGYSVYALDHRGQGASPRFLHDTEKGYVDHFSAFVYDLKKFVDAVVPPSSDCPRYLLAHSLGGSIGAYYLELFGNDFRAAVLSSPMLEINLGKQELLAAAQLFALIGLGKGADYAPGTGYYDPAQLPFDNNDVTHSEARFSMNKQILVDNHELFLAGQTAQWVLEAIKGSFIGRHYGALVKTPVRVFQAGQDQIVLPGGQNVFCSAAKTCQLLHFAEARHEILQESDPIRERAMSEILTFFGAN